MLLRVMELEFKDIVGIYCSCEKGRGKNSFNLWKGRNICWF